MVSLCDDLEEALTYSFTCIHSNRSQDWRVGTLEQDRGEESVCEHEGPRRNVTRGEWECAEGRDDTLSEATINQNQCLIIRKMFVSPCFPSLAFSKYLWTDIEKVCQCANYNALRQVRVHILLPRNQFFVLDCAHSHSGALLVMCLGLNISIVFSIEQAERINFKHFYG